MFFLFVHNKQCVGKNQLTEVVIKIKVGTKRGTKNLQMTLNKLGGLFCAVFVLNSVSHNLLMNISVIMFLLSKTQETY